MRSCQTATTPDSGNVSEPGRVRRAAGCDPRSARTANAAASDRIRLGRPGRRPGLPPPGGLRRQARSPLMCRWSRTATTSPASGEPHCRTRTLNWGSRTYQTFYIGPDRPVRPRNSTGTPRVEMPVRAPNSADAIWPMSIPSGQLATVRPGQWNWPTPCTDWNVRQLVNHRVQGNLNHFRLLDGATGAEFLRSRDADALRADPPGAYARSAQECAVAFSRPGALQQVPDYPLGRVIGQQALAVRA